MARLNTKEYMAVATSVATVVGLVVMNRDYRRATKFISPTLTVKATRQHRNDGQSPQATVLVTIGKPNFVERRFIRQCQLAGEKFPVKKIQVKDWPA